MVNTAPSLCLVDVGTHMGQEYLALLGHGRLGYLRHYLRHRRRTRRKGLVPIPVAGFRAFLAAADALRRHRANIAYVMVEPNARLFALPVYRQADHAFNIALSSDPATASLLPLFLADGNPTGQGSSLFEAKPNVSLKDYDLVINLDTLHCARCVRANLSRQGNESGPVMLRNNNEGAEVDVIHAFHQVFGVRLRAVMGSLNDVAKVKGAAALGALHEFLAGRGIPFLPLHADFATWPPAVVHLNGLLTIR